jgi:hypothetical protein
MKKLVPKMQYLVNIFHLLRPFIAIKNSSVSQATCRTERKKEQVGGGIAAALHDYKARKVDSGSSQPGSLCLSVGCPAFRQPVERKGK